MSIGKSAISKNFIAVAFVIGKICKTSAKRLSIVEKIFNVWRKIPDRFGNFYKNTEKQDFGELNKLSSKAEYVIMSCMCEPTLTILYTKAAQQTIILSEFNLQGEPIMKLKKIYAALTAAAMLLTATACSSSTTSSSDTANESGDSSAADNNSTASDTEADNTASDTESEADSDAEVVANDGTVYKIGICQLVEHPALDAATEGFIAALTDKLGDNVEFDQQNAQGESTNCTTITTGFVAADVDLILANATAALQAAASATETIPIIGTSITDYATALDISDWTGKTGFNVTGTSDLAPIDQQEDMLVELFPDVKQVGILYCSAEANSKYQANLFEEALAADGIAYKEYSAADTNEIRTVVTTAVAECDVLYIPTDNTMASNTEVVRNAALDAGVPIIAGEEGICSGCGVATLSISYYDIGYTAGEMAYEILVNGTDPGDMDIQFAPNVVKEYNAEICEELGITPPEGYVAIATEE
jgi:putative ABC transport system substrate-binding protein